MSRQRSDKHCVTIEICVDNELNDAIERYQARLRLNDNKVRKPEAAERFLAELYKIGKDQINLS